MPEEFDTNFRNQASGTSLDGEKTKPETELASAGAGNYRPGRTAVGAAESGAPHYKVGEQLECLVLAIRPGGYEILILKDGIEGYLKSTETRAVGSTFMAQFLLWQDKPKK